CPVIGVPTSVGYGSSFGGMAALLAMLNSCAPGVAVVNIDNGFGAAVYAHLILRRISRQVNRP
ncbi:MAG: 1-(5-phosphoribosyl)-5-amino-4-imidazole-carboxylate carboxylase, partial [Chloroflexota bacterium]|nr:1-(5-phosphoribosyl)-5-amino-4-imidazole-carboxylate carboxylase [Chloroflexota bacterium]